jgi:4-amino-4-deoxy-L-arabinose transferase-like glycosyltransferase
VLARLRDQTAVPRCARESGVARPAARAAAAPLSPVVAVLALASFALHLATHRRYGYFGDELYLLALSDHLAWGYVDQPPAALALLAGFRTLFGDSLLAIRALSALAASATLVATCALARELRGGTAAQLVAGSALSIAPGFLVIGHYYSANVFDQLVWALALLLLMRIFERPTLRRWLLLGALLGIGLENKLGVSWLCAGIAAGLVLTRERRLLASPGPWLAAALAAVLIAPHLAWQAQHGWPTLEFIRNISERKLVAAPPARFLLHQVLALHPLVFPLAGLGLAHLWFAEDGRRRPFAIVFLVAAGILLAHGTSKAYYLFAAYPPLLAAGGVAVERFAATARREGRGLARRAPLLLAALLLAAGALCLPLSLPILPVDRLLSLQHRIGFRAPQEDRRAPYELSGHFANMLGWPEVVAALTRAHGGLAADERARARILAYDYMDASALVVLGRGSGLPPVHSPHNAFALLDPVPEDVPVVLVLGRDAGELRRYFGRVDTVDRVGCEFCLPERRGRPVYVAREPRLPFPSLLAALRHFD